MHRIAKTLIVLVASLAVGACAARIQVATPLVITVPEPVVAPVAPVLDELAIRDFEFNALLGEDAVVGEVPLLPTCDIAAIVAQTATDPELKAYPVKAGRSLHSYIEVRFGKVKPYTDYELDIGLRVLDLETCTTRVVGIQKRYGKARVQVPVTTKSGTVWKEALKPVATLAAPDGWSIEAIRRANGIQWNNWATDFSVTEPAGKVVVGVRWPYVPKVIIRRAPRVDPVTYVPYVRGLHLPELIEDGKEYRKELGDRAYDELRALQVPSRAFPGTLVADVDAIEASFLTTLAANEHMDPGEFVLDSRWTADRIHIVLGANRENTARYTCSSKGACGLMQFMPGTYRDMRRRYPTAKLMTDTNEGRRDHLNAMKAAILLHDNNLAYFRERLTPEQFAQILADKVLRRQLLASAYNTGAGRTVTVYLIALQKKITPWTEAKGRRCSKATKWAECLMEETKGYLAKDEFLNGPWPVDEFAARP